MIAVQLHFVVIVARNGVGTLAVGGALVLVLKLVLGHELLLLHRSCCMPLLANCRWHAGSCRLPQTIRAVRYLEAVFDFNLNFNFNLNLQLQLNVQVFVVQSVNNLCV